MSAVVIAAGAGSFDAVDRLLAAAPSGGWAARILVLVPAALHEIACTRWPAARCEPEPAEGLDGWLSSVARTAGAQGLLVVLSGPAPTARAAPPSCSTRAGPCSSRRRTPPSSTRARAR